MNATFWFTVTRQAYKFCLPCSYLVLINTTQDLLSFFWSPNQLINNKIHRKRKLSYQNLFLGNLWFLTTKSIKTIPLRITYTSPGWCGSVVECQSENQRVTGLIPSLGHLPGLQARSPVGGAQETTTRCLSPSVSPSLHLCLKINK